MEAIGLVASIITLISAASHAASLLERVLGLRGIPLYVLGAINEVTDFKAILTLVKTAFEETQHQLPLEYQVEYSRLSDRAMGCINAFTKHLHRNVLREREGAIGDHKVTELKRRVKWMEALGRGQAQGQIDSFQQELASLKLSFVLAISATNLKITTRLSTVIQDVSIVHGQDIRPETIVHGKAIDLPYAMEKAACMSTMSSTTDDTLVDQQIDLTSYVKIETIQTATNRICRSSCPCDCHVPCQGTTPRWLRGLVGAAFYKLTSVPLLNRRICNYGHCHQRSNGTGSLHFRYFFPVWLLPLGIEVAASWRSLGGVGGTWSLKIPRVITDPIPIYQLCQAILSGATLDVQRMMRLYGVNIVDMLMYYQEPQSFLNIALMRGDLFMPLVTMLLDEGVDLHSPALSNGKTPAQLFSLAHALGNPIDELRHRPYFQDICVELNLAPATELLFQRCSDRLKDLLQKQPSAALVRDSIGKTPLHWAVALKNHEAIDMLIEAGADVHAVGHDGRTPLYDAICVLGRSRTTCIKMIQAGSDVNHTTPDGSSPLRNAIDVNSLVPVVDILIDAGADVHHVHNGENLLHITAKACTAFTCEELLWAGVDIDARTRFGHTAAMIAAQNNNHDVLKTLIYHRAQLNNTTLEGHTVVHSAASCGDIETMKILEQACIKGLPMDEEALEQYWLWFDERVHYIIPTRRATLEAEEAAFQALLDSITPARSAMLEHEHHEDHEAFHIPGAFPINPDEPNCDSRIAKVQEQDDDDGYEEGRDSDDESWITTDDDSPSCEAGMEAASDDEVDELI